MLPKLNRLLFLIIVFSLSFAACREAEPLPTVTSTLYTAVATKTTTPPPLPRTSSPVPTQTIASSSRLPTDTPTPTPSPTETPTLPVWEQVARGISQRYVPVKKRDSDAEFFIYALRIDPEQVIFRVHYDSEAKSIEEWQSETGAPIILNGGFFSGKHTPVGRIVVDGTLYGFPLSYGEDSISVPGLFTVLEQDIQIYSAGKDQFTPRGMRFDQAIEAYPMLVLPGGQPTFPEETGYIARRTVIALDRDGYVIVLISDLPLLSLHELSIWLSESDLNLDTALNLDGGRSTAMMMLLGGQGKHFPAYVPLPIVLGIYPD